MADELEKAVTDALEAVAKQGDIVRSLKSSLKEQKAEKVWHWFSISCTLNSYPKPVISWLCNNFPYNCLKMIGCFYRQMLIKLLPSCKS